MSLKFKKSDVHTPGNRVRIYGSGGRLKTSSNVVTIVQSGLALHLDASNPTSWPGSGTTWYDLSGNGNNAEAAGTPTYTATNGGGFTFDSVNDYFDTAPNLRESYVGTGLTAAAWVNANYFPFVEGIIERGSWANSDGWGLYVHFGYLLNGPKYGYAPGTTALSSGVNYLLGFTIDTSGTAIVYINGVSNGGNSGSPGLLPSASSISPLIGRGGIGSAYPWSGDIYEVQIYNRALTGAEMLYNFNVTKGRFGL